MNKWTHLHKDGMATNPDPEYGGIIDYASMSGLWFVISNNDSIPSIEGLESKEEAFKYLNLQIAKYNSKRMMNLSDY
jgi:hypothetical protein